jgi:signal transduction histidine kinase
MKAGLLNGQVKGNVGQPRPALNGVKPVTTARVDNDRMTRLLHLAQEMGGPLNVVIGRMEYLLERGTDRETTRSLKAIFSQAQQLVALRQQQLDEARINLGVADPGSPVLIERGLPEA